MDGWADTADNCPGIYNPGQRDSDGDGVGDSCDICVCEVNPLQQDNDNDGVGNQCDSIFGIPPIPPVNDADQDGWANDHDNCPCTENPEQEDTDFDGYGDSCDVCDYRLVELPMYGSGRIGVARPDISIFDAPNTGPVYTRELGEKHYELTDHLGNVRAVLGDRKLTGTPGAGNYYADVEAYTHQYPFGMPQPGRTWDNSVEYRYGFNGMETDPEVKGESGNHYTTYFRQYDPRVGRWWSRDPVTHPWESPYVAFHNNPALLSDPLGNDPPPPPDCPECMKIKNPYPGQEVKDKSGQKWYYNGHSWAKLLTMQDMVSPRVPTTGGSQPSGSSRGSALSSAATGAAGGRGSGSGSRAAQAISGGTVSGSSRPAVSEDWERCPSCSTAYLGGRQFFHQGSWISEKAYRQKVDEYARAIAYENHSYSPSAAGFTSDDFRAGSDSREILSEELGKYRYRSLYDDGGRFNTLRTDALEDPGILDPIPWIVGFGVGRLFVRGSQGAIGAGAVDEAAASSTDDIVRAGVDDAIVGTMDDVVVTSVDDVVRVEMSEGVVSTAKGVVDNVDDFIVGQTSRLYDKLGAKIGRGELPFAKGKQGVLDAIESVRTTLSNPTQTTGVIPKSALRGEYDLIHIYSSKSGNTVSLRILGNGKYEFDTLIPGKSSKF